MAATDETEGQRDGAGAGPPPKRQPGWVRPAKRYGPIVVVLALIGAAVLVFGDGSDDGDDEAATDGASASEEELIASGPMTWQKAELEGETDSIDWGPNCDTETGKLKLVSVYAPPCVEPFEGENGGATSPGVTAETVKVVEYIADPALDPLTTAFAAGAGAEIDPESAAETVQGFADLYNRMYETYGRRVEIEVYTGTGAGADLEAARADAIAIAEKEPFIVVRGSGQAGPVFATELASRGIVCASFCATAVPEEIVEQYQPYIWQSTPTPDQAAALSAEMIGNWPGRARPSWRGTTPRGRGIACTACCTTTIPTVTTRPCSRRCVTGWPTTASNWPPTSSSISTWPMPRRTRAPTSPGSKKWPSRRSSTPAIRSRPPR
jgi:hypothetical protein